VCGCKRSTAAGSRVAEGYMRSNQRGEKGQLGEWRCRKMPGSAEWRVYYPRRAVDFEKVGPSEVGLDPR
jgi:hypothetical protein